jgi:hypothetical protein
MLETELAFIIFLVSYLLLFIIIGKIISKEYLWNYSRKKEDRDFSLAMAGFSVTAIALVLTIEYSHIILFSPIILFLSISLATLTLSWYINRFQVEWFQMGFGSFVSNVLTNTGIMSLSSGFIEFFYSGLPKELVNDWFPICLVFGTLIVAIGVVSSLDLLKRTRFWNGKCKVFILAIWLIVAILATLVVYLHL